MLYKIENILTKVELTDLIDFIKKNKKYDSVPDKVANNLGKNAYYRKKYPVSLTLNKKILKLAKENTGINYKISGSWVNFVFTNSNINDNYHTDLSNLTFVIYLNDDFEGGEFEYIDTNQKMKKIKPKKNLGLIMSNKLSHRVCNVKNGIRYSLILFLNYKEKKATSVI